MIAHDVVTYICAMEAGFPFKEVEVRELPYTEDSVPFNEENLFHFREGKPPAVFSDDPRYSEGEYYENFVGYRDPKDNKYPAIHVLSIYSAEPDWGMDQDLNLSPLQGFLGGSQGYRHLRYSLLGIKVGIPHRMMDYFTSKAEREFKSGNNYWGLRFAGRALHYLEDLLTPFHVKPFTEIYLLRNLFNREGLYYRIYNYHLNYERYVGYLLWHGNERLIEAVKYGARMVETLTNESFKNAVLHGYREAKRVFNPIFEECIRIWGDSMSGRYVKISPDEIDRIRSNWFIDLSCRWLQNVSALVRKYIEIFLKPYLGEMLD